MSIANILFESRLKPATGAEHHTLAAMHHEMAARHHHAAAEAYHQGNNHEAADQAAAAHRHWVACEVWLMEANELSKKAIDMLNRMAASRKDVSAN